MPIYRCYLLNQDQRIGGLSELEAEDDAQALAKAAELGHPAELWEGSRFVGRVGGVMQAMRAET